MMNLEIPLNVEIRIQAESHYTLRNVLDQMEKLRQSNETPETRRELDYLQTLITSKYPEAVRPAT